jgi:hypothetical protein
MAARRCTFSFFQPLERPLQALPLTSRFSLVAAVVAATVAAACSDPAATEPMNQAGATSAGSAGMAQAGGGTGGAGSGGGLGGQSVAGGGASGMGGVNTMPTLLSETGLYADIKARALAPGVKAFAPAYTLWSDGASKNRYVFMPEGKKITSDEMEFWQYPEGFKLWKDFTRDGKLIETRLLQKLGDGKANWYMVAFKWKDDYSDAEAVPMGVPNAMGTAHDVPSQEDCKGCHSALGDYAIGFSALMLSHDLPDSLNLAQIAALGWLTTPPAAAGYALPGTETEKAALGYMHANCGMCHNIKSQVYKTSVSLDLWTHLGQIDAVQKTRAYLSLVCDQWPGDPNALPPAVAHDKFGPITECETGHATGANMDKTEISKPKRLVPKDPANSSIIDLMTLRATGMVGEMKQMPPIGTELKDDAGLAAITTWLNSLPAN